MNNLRNFLIAAGMIASPWFISACGNTADSDGDDNDASGRSGICQSICERAEECDVTGRNECVQACNDDDVSSSAALQVVEICADDVNCTGFADGTLAECVSEGIADLDASTAAEDYCDTLTDWYLDCVGEALSPAECYSDANAVSSGYLAEIAECLDEGCEGAAACLESVQERYDAGDSIIQLVADGFDGGDATCCSAGDPCGWAGDDICDCSGDFAWDSADCGSVEPIPDSCTYANDGECDEPNLCVAGTDTTDCGGTIDCCAAGDPCGWANDAVCDCSGEFAWDAADCGVVAVDDSCEYALDNICDEPEFCTTGTDTTDCELEIACCVSGDPCGWASDSYCDCGGTYAWDAVDCGGAVGDSCTYALDGICDEPEFCTTGTDTTDCSAEPSCCSAGDPCAYANDGVCDCGGDFTWDANDCTGTVGDSCQWAVDGVCDEPLNCDYGTDGTDCAGSCCSATDPCSWAGDDICDCDGAFAWDAVDCGL